MAAPKIKHVFGNVLRLAIPLTLRTVEFVNGQIEVNDTDFIPSSEYPVKVVLSKGAVKISLDAEMRNGNVAFVEDKGKIPVGVYEITVTCNDDNGYPYRFNQMSVLQVFHSTAEAGIVQPIEFNATTWYLDAAIFLALKGENGVGIEDVVTETSGEIGGTNTVTIILTDGRERSFTILNGSGAVDQELDITSPSPISNAAVTAKFSEIDAMLSDIIGDVDYDSQSKNIRFWDKGKTKILMSLDARPFIKDGMVNSVYISNNILVITFNTDAGREAIGVPLTSIFNPNNYYNKTQVDNRLAQINAMFSSYYNKSQIDTMLVNIDKYAELDKFGRLKYDQASTIVLDAIEYPEYEVEVGDPMIYGNSNGHIIKVELGDAGIEMTDLGVAPQLVFLNKEDSNFYRWNGSIWQRAGGNSDFVQAQPDWNETDTTVPAYIKNKPTLITQSDIDATVAALVDSAPQTLDTLNELAAALGDDPNFATTVTNALGNKVDKVNGKGLSTNDYTTAEKNKLAGIASGAEVNVQADWNVTSTSSDAFIRNKPTIPTKTSDLVNDSGYTTNTGTLTEADFDVSTQQDGTIVMTVGEDTYTINLNHEHPQYVNANDLDDYIVAGTNVTIVKDSQTGVLTISSTGGSGSSTQVQANWNESDTTSAAYIQNKPTIPDVSGKADKSEMSVSTSSDQTTITLKSGTSATVINQHQSLNGYAKYVLCQDEASYNAIQNKDSDTLYLIPEASE